MSARRRPPRGFILFVVLGALAALSVLLSTGISQALADRRAARADLAAAQARLAAEGAVELGIARGGSGSGKLGAGSYSFSTGRTTEGATLVRGHGAAGEAGWSIEVTYRRGAHGPEIQTWRENP